MISATQEPIAPLPDAAAARRSASVEPSTAALIAALSARTCCGSKSKAEIRASVILSPSPATGYVPIIKSMSVRKPYPNNASYLKSWFTTLRCVVWSMSLIGDRHSVATGFG